MSSTLKSKIYQLLFALIIFTLPSNLFFKFGESYAYVNGLQIDYLIPKFYLSDIFILLILLVWLFSQLHFFHINQIPSQIKKSLNSIIDPIEKNPILASLALIFITRQLLTIHPLASVWYLVKILEFSLLGIFIYKHRHLLLLRNFKKTILLATFFTLIFQSLLAIYQTYTQTSLFGYLFFGEPNLINYIGLAKHTIGGVEKILPYGTTAHPNILGGILAIYLIFAIYYLLKNSKKSLSRFAIILTILIPSYALYLTHSVSAWATFGVGIFLITAKKMLPKFKISSPQKTLFLSLSFILLTPLLINFFTPAHPKNPSLYRRIYLSDTALQMFEKSPFFGVGLNNFTTRVEKYSRTKEVARFAQPVHNIGWLFLSEVGLLGAIILLILIYKLPKKSQLVTPFLILLPIAALDHYLLTTQSGLLLLTLMLSKEISKQKVL